MSSGHPAAPPGGHVVIAELDVKSDRLGDFVALAFEDYDHLAAFAAHRASGHLARFKADFQGMVAGEQPLRQGVLERDRT